MKTDYDYKYASELLSIPEKAIQQSKDQFLRMVNGSISVDPIANTMYQNRHYFSIY